LPQEITASNSCVKDAVIFCAHFQRPRFDALKCLSFAFFCHDWQVV